CAVVGFKPSYGLVSTDGVFPLAPSFDHAGPMARDVATCIELMRVLAGLESEEPRPARVGIAWADAAEPLVRQRVEESGALLDATPVAFPLPEGTTALFM